VQVQCKVFNTTYNPERIRLGSRILHQRLKGPAIASYYPPRIGTISQLRSLYPEHQIIDEEEEDWLEHLNVAKSRGKSAPKKKRTAAGEDNTCGIGLAQDTDLVQNPRSSTRGSRQISHDTTFRNSLIGVTILDNVPACHEAIVQNPCLGPGPEQSHHILLFISFALLAFHSLANSSSHAVLTSRCSCITGAFTLWCSTVQ
jgi:small subunit ribosomal protein S33